MAFSNRIRLPFKITRPQFPEDKTVFRNAAGETKTLSVVVRKTYEGETDYLPEKLHQRLTIALAHDNITIEGDKYLGGVSKEGDYTINWQTFLDYPTAKASFTVDVTPFDNTNSNCMTCDMATQLAVVDDDFPATLEENTEYSMDVATNDSICCWPAVFSLTTYNTDFLASASIDQMGNLTVKTKNGGYPSATGIKIATYRVTCPNGSFDEADVYAVLDGDEPACQQPSGILFSDITSNQALVTFTAAPGPPNHYLWRLYKASAPGVLVQQGTSAATTFLLTGLDPSVEYIIYIRSQCDATNDDATASNFIQRNFTTANATSLCGAYLIRYDDFSAIPTFLIFINYLDCNGANQVLLVTNHQPKSICAAQTGPGSPVSISSSAPSKTSISYEGNC
jgi:hypothetical protein